MSCIDLLLKDVSLRIEMDKLSWKLAEEKLN